MSNQNNHLSEPQCFQISNGKLINKNVPYSIMTFLFHTDQELFYHSRRVEKMCKQIGQELDLSSYSIARLCLFARLHDLGKLFVPRETLYKPGPLNETEYSTIKQHSIFGYTLIKRFPHIEDVGSLVLKHHEWWNGMGYPFGLKEDMIPFECRILAIADAFDAMTNDRPYRKAMSKTQAIKELEECSGKQFDPHLTRLCIKIFGD